jgi:hypothetical protein
MTQPKGDYVVGQRVFYVLPRSPKHGRPAMVFWSGTVTRVGPTRVTMALDGETRRRAVARWSLTTTVFEGDTIRGLGVDGLGAAE